MSVEGLMTYVACKSHCTVSDHVMANFESQGSQLNLIQNTSTLRSFFISRGNALEVHRDVIELS